MLCCFSLAVPDNITIINKNYIILYYKLQANSYRAIYSSLKFFKVNSSESISVNCSNKTFILVAKFLENSVVVYGLPYTLKILTTLPPIHTFIPTYVSILFIGIYSMFKKGHIS